MNRIGLIPFAKRKSGWWLVLSLTGMFVLTAQAFDAKKPVRRGNSTLGATINLSGRDILTTGSYTVQSQAEATARLLGSSVLLGESHGSVTVTENGTATVQLRLTADDKTLVNYTNSFSQSSSFVVPSYVTSKEVAETTVWAGPVPITVKARANVSLSGSGSVQVVQSSNLLPTVRAGLFSSLDASARGTARAQRDVASVSFRGSAKFAKANLVTRAKISPSTTNDSTRADHEVTYSLAKAEGNMSAQAKVKLPLAGHKTYSRSLGAFTGSALSGTLARGSAVLP